MFLRNRKKDLVLYESDYQVTIINVDYVKARLREEVKRVYKQDAYEDFLFIAGEGASESWSCPVTYFYKDSVAKTYKSCSFACGSCAEDQLKELFSCYISEDRLSDYFLKIEDDKIFIIKADSHSEK